MELSENEKHKRKGDGEKGKKGEKKDVFVECLNACVCVRVFVCVGICSCKQEKKKKEASLNYVQRNRRGR